MTYDQLCHQEQPGVSPQTPQKVLILVTGEWYSNFYMILELASKYYLWQVGSVLFFWCYTSNPRLVNNWCTRNTGKWYAANCTYAMTYFWIKTEMIMITQPPCSMRLWMWTTKLQFWELVCIAIHFQIFVCNISIILNMILSVCEFSFTGSFSIFSLINESMFTMLLSHIFLYLFQPDWHHCFVCKNAWESANQMFLSQ